MPNKVKRPLSLEASNRYLKRLESNLFRINSQHLFLTTRQVLKSLDTLKKRDLSKIDHDRLKELAKYTSDFLDSKGSQVYEFDYLDHRNMRYTLNNMTKIYWELSSITQRIDEHERNVYSFEHLISKFGGDKRLNNWKKRYASAMEHLAYATLKENGHNKKNEPRAYCWLYESMEEHLYQIELARYNRHINKERFHSKKIMTLFDMAIDLFNDDLIDIKDSYQDLGVSEHIANTDNDPSDFFDILTNLDPLIMSNKEKDKLASCYRKSLRVLLRHGELEFNTVFDGDTYSQINKMGVVISSRLMENDKSDGGSGLGQSRALRHMINSLSLLSIHGIATNIDDENNTLNSAILMQIAAKIDYAYLFEKSHLLFIQTHELFSISRTRLSDESQISAVELALDKISTFVNNTQT